MIVLAAVVEGVEVVAAAPSEHATSSLERNYRSPEDLQEQYQQSAHHFHTPNMGLRAHATKSVHPNVPQYWLKTVLFGRAQ